MAATMLGQGKNAWQAEIDAAAEVGSVLQFPAVRLLNLCPPALRLLPFRGEIRGGTLFATATKKFTRSLEVSLYGPSPIAHPHKRP